MNGGSLVYYYYLLSKCTAEDVIVVTGTTDQSAKFDANVPYKILRKSYIPHVVESSRLRKLVWLISLFPLLLFWIFKYHVSVVHIGVFFPDLIAGWLVARLTRCSLMVTIHGEEITTADLGPKSVSEELRQLLNQAANWILCHCDLVLTNSSFTKQVLLQLGVPEDRIVPITPGIDINKTSPGKEIDPATASQLAGKRVLLTVGRFNLRKGQDMVLRALPQVLLKYPDLMYIIAGSRCGNNYEYCTHIIQELGLHNHTMILEKPDDESIAWLYEICEVFIMANRTLACGDTEGYGIVFLEAGAWGKPVIGGRAGGVIDAVDDGVTGILVDGTNVDEIANAIIKLLSDNDLAKQMGEAGRQKVLRNNWDEKANLYLKLLDGLVTKKRANRRAIRPG